MPTKEELLAARERAQKVLDQLRATGPEHFDMGHWGWTEDTDSLDLAQLDEMPPLSRCGTTACLAGHIALACPVEYQELIEHELDAGVPKHEISTTWLSIELADLLLLDSRERWFYTHSWPTDFVFERDARREAAYDAHEDAAAYGRAIQAIDHDIVVRRLEAHIGELTAQLAGAQP